MKTSTKMKCPNCGAPVTTEICKYCNSQTGIDTKVAVMEYPVIRCKEATLNFWNFKFLIFIGSLFTLAGIYTWFLERISSDEFHGPPACFIFLLLAGFILIYVALVPVRRNKIIKKKGKEIEATVYGYINDNLSVNDLPAQIVKLLIETNDGPKFILYKLGIPIKPYKINSKIKLKVYKNIFQVIDKDLYYM